MSELVLTDRAALELIDQAEAALAQADNADDADELWRKVKAVEEAARLARVSKAPAVEESDGDNPTKGRLVGPEHLFDSDWSAG